LREEMGRGVDGWKGSRVGEWESGRVIGRGYGNNKNVDWVMKIAT
jgi:hypothetical protein